MLLAPIENSPPEIHAIPGGARSGFGAAFGTVAPNALPAATAGRGEAGASRSIETAITPAMTQSTAAAQSAGRKADAMEALQNAMIPLRARRRALSACRRPDPPGRPPLDASY